MTALVWFRHDLRISDHPALDAALRAHDRVVPVFCFDDRLLAGRHASGPRTRFLIECLEDLDAELRERGARLVVRRERPERALIELAGITGATEVYYTRDVTPFARSRGRSVHAALEAAGIAEQALPGLTVADDVAAVRTRAGGPYAVFSPFYRSWLDIPRRAPIPAPAHIPSPPGLDHGRIPTADELGLSAALEGAQRGGEREAVARLDRFLRGPIHQYAEERDRPDLDGTSKLSAYLHFGCLSPREVEAALPRGEGPQQWRRQLCWRDFYHHVQFHYPENARLEYQVRYRGTIAWTEDDALFAAWTEGRTGFPLVDAAMRQLRRDGWMHNRARLVAGSFLTKQLGIDWRRGEQWFMRLLIDGDQANNNGNWQWIASVGVDPQPVFRRVYNPTLHLERYDPEGVYVREYVPELRRVPRRHLAEPWKMPESVQREAGCVIGSDYPRPVVDLAAAREAALARYAAAAAADA
ncbi:deoxyribodipyrimidine photo-lyase [Actinocrinis puniceicyclus]|uniref:Deoxyribodipyrimidine photo-lyase n=1 Tax=Actinocrinis puniceicyclus TaxID=977794 RepID=A0A8J7WLR4_9ACTN|nr:deoxyribodipyrimidine photo-lyase [Actinocrinis puniceicyclus]MBS2963603.1 deoxyribodipyrimidine photo-lyase [Actinocrinis puniceicyclus]